MRIPIIFPWKKNSAFGIVRPETSRRIAVRFTVDTPAM